MILRSSPSSPFGRKVKMSALMLGLMDRIEIVPANTRDPKDTLIEQNPLGKIPVLLPGDGPPLYDSAVICEYLDAVAGGAKLFPTGEARWPALRLHAEADGLMEAALLQVYEKRFRPEEKWHQPWLDRQQQKVERTLADLEASPPKLEGQPNIGDVGLACALGYLDYRFAGVWRAGNPNLVRWLDTFAAQAPAFEQTAPHE